MAKTIVAFGEILWDLLPDGPTLGGAVFNFAYRAATLGERALIVSRIGRDNYGAAARMTADRLGMDLKHLQQDDDLPTGTVRVRIDPGGEPSYFIVPEVAYDNIQATESLLADAAGCDCVCYGTLIQRAEPSRRALRRVLETAEKAVKLLDLNLRPDCHSPETIAESLEFADILKLNETEAAELARRYGAPTDDPAAMIERMLGRWSLQAMVITFGPRGALAGSAEGELCYESGYDVREVDTCGSGDAFTAGFIHRRLAGDSLRACCAAGNALGAMVSGQTGATGVIDPGAVDRFLAGGPARVVDPALAARFPAEQ